MLSSAKSASRESAAPALSRIPQFQSGFLRGYKFLCLRGAELPLVKEVGIDLLAGGAHGFSVDDRRRGNREMLMSAAATRKFKNKIAGRSRCAHLIQSKCIVKASKFTRSECEPHKVQLIKEVSYSTAISILCMTRVAIATNLKCARAVVPTSWSKSILKHIPTSMPPW
jgi:hypothetical protein